MNTPSIKITTRLTGYFLIIKIKLQEISTTIAYQFKSYRFTIENKVMVKITK
jgi:hypothetical protein